MLALSTFFVADFFGTQYGDRGAANLTGTGVVHTALPSREQHPAALPPFWTEQCALIADLPTHGRLWLLPEGVAVPGSGTTVRGYYTQDFTQFVPTNIVAPPRQSRDADLFVRAPGSRKCAWGEWLSNDGGATWTKPSGPVGAYIIVTVVNDEFVMFSRNTAYLARSLDGVTWDVLSPLGLPPQILAVAPHSTGVCVVVDGLWGTNRIFTAADLAGPYTGLTHTALSNILLLHGHAGKTYLAADAAQGLFLYDVAAQNIFPATQILGQIYDVCAFGDHMFFREHTEFQCFVGGQAQAPVRFHPAGEPGGPPLGFRHVSSAIGEASVPEVVPPPFWRDHTLTYERP